VPTRRSSKLKMTVLECIEDTKLLTPLALRVSSLWVLFSLLHYIVLCTNLKLLHNKGEINFKAVTNE
jgi:hypothetical protein